LRKKIEVVSICLRSAICGVCGCVKKYAALLLRKNSSVALRCVTLRRYGMLETSSKAEDCG